MLSLSPPPLPPSPLCGTTHIPVASILPPFPSQNFFCYKKKGNFPLVYKTNNIKNRLISELINKLFLKAMFFKFVKIIYDTLEQWLYTMLTFLLYPNPHWIFLILHPHCLWYTCVPNKWGLSGLLRYSLPLFSVGH